ncbi:Uncharacterised protein [Mycobacteroides abscessus subsp. abscessus]|nr:Uncharacterised protein [Mycobacteroides abscessus subsp. abscessus]
MPTSTAPGTQPQPTTRVIQMASTTRPIISESLWAPPMKSMTSTGFRVPNQAARAGSTRYRCASRGRKMPIRPTPTRAGMRISNAERYGSNPARSTSRWLICRLNGP